MHIILASFNIFVECLKLGNLVIQGVVSRQPHQPLPPFLLDYLAWLFRFFHLAVVEDALLGRIFKNRMVDLLLSSEDLVYIRGCLDLHRLEWVI